MSSDTGQLLGMDESYYLFLKDRRRSAGGHQALTRGTFLVHLHYA